VSTTLTPKDPTDEPTADLAATGGVRDSGSASHAVERCRRAFVFGFPVALVGAFVALGWTAEWFREVVGWIAPHLAVLLWAAAAVLLGVSLARRIAGTGLRAPEGAGRFRFLLAPSALAGSVIAYLVQLFASWERGGASFFTIGGLVPWSDAYAYFGGAQRLLFDGQLDNFNSRRPLHAAFLASELAFTNLDLRKVLVIQAVLLGVASYLAARAVAKDLGPLAGLVLFTGIYGFARVGVHTVMSETLGVTMGALAFAALWSAVRTRNVWLVAGGLFLLAFAFHFRSGPVLLLLTLPVVFAWLLRGKQRVNWRVLGLSVTAVIVAFSASYIALFTFHGDRQSLNTTADQVIYGMARGLPGWSSQPVSWYQIYVDHPEIMDMSATERTKFVSARARDELREHPGAFARSYVEGGWNYATDTGDYITAPVSSLRGVVYACALLLAVVALMARWRASSRRVLLDVILFAGVVLALPTFVGAWQYDDHARWGWGVVGAGSYLPWWFGAAVGALAFIAFILVGTERLRVGPYLVLAAMTVVTVAVMIPILGADTVRNFAPAVPFLAFTFALAVAVIERVPLPGRATVATTATPTRNTPGLLWAPLVIGGAVAAIAVIGAPIASAAVDNPAPLARTCPDGRRAEPLIGGAAVRLVGGSGAENKLNEVEASRVSSAPPMHTLQEKHVFGPIHANMTVIGGLTERGDDRIAFVDGAVSAPRRSILYLCGSTISDSKTNEDLRPSAVPIDVFTGTPMDATATRSAP
jgi:hypothetical protein